MTDPRIAVLIPVYNEELVLKGTIDALVATGFDRRDIYVVNDRSTDNTESVGRECGVHVFTVPENGGKARAQTAGLKHFGLIDGPLKYDWVVLIDGDSKVEHSFLSAMKAAAEKEPELDLFVGQVKSAKNNHVYSASRASEYCLGHDLIKQGQSNFNVIFVSPGCASMYKSSTLEKLHIDHETLAEDMDLTMQVHRLKGKIRYVSGAGVLTQDPNNFKDYHKQIMRWFRGYWQVVLKHKLLTRLPRQPVDWYMLLMMIDTIVFNRITWLIGAFTVFPISFFWVIGLDIGIALLVACYTAFKARRWDVIYRLPQYYWLTHLGFYAYMRSFIEIVVLRKKMLAWNKVQRYQFDSATSA